jgi:tetratricopeptide (TPR) repeat protein
MKPSLILGSVAALASFAPAAAAKSPKEVEQIARSVTVEIRTESSDGDTSGSGSIIHRQGNLYTVITNRHVICGSIKCQLPTQMTYNVIAPDGQYHQVPVKNVKLLDQSLDLAIIQFQSKVSYPIAKIFWQDKLRSDDTIYAAGFPNGKGLFFNSGKVRAASNRRLENDDGGYTIVYDANTLRGMSGGGIFDQEGRLIAIHGQGDRFPIKTNAPTDSTEKIIYFLNAIAEGDSHTVMQGSKVGYNRGISVWWVLKGLAKINIFVDNNSSNVLNSDVEINSEKSADEYFILGLNKVVTPGANFQSGMKEAVQYLDKAIKVDPQYTVAYFLRAFAHNKMQNYSKELEDYNRVIYLDSKLAEPYVSRGNLKRDKLQDFQGALSDYNQAILIDPDYTRAYFNRGVLKYKLNDRVGANQDLKIANEIEKKRRSKFTDEPTDFVIPVSEGTHFQERFENLKSSYVIHANAWSGSVLKDLIIIEFSSNHLKSLTIAKSASWKYSKKEWTIHNGRKYIFRVGDKKIFDKSTSFSTQSSRIPITPRKISDFLSQEKTPPAPLLVTTYSYGSGERYLNLIFSATISNYGDKSAVLSRVVMIELGNTQKAMPNKIILAESGKLCGGIVKLKDARFYVPPNAFGKANSLAINFNNGSDAGQCEQWH